MAEKKTILVVDDETDVQTFLTTLLQDNGYETMTAENGEEALERIKGKRPDLVSLDITMPETSGVRFYRNIRESGEWKAIPVIIVTGISEEFEKFISTRKQVPPPEGYVSKPINEKEFLDLVKKLT
jgi:two-component system phosphate regulon response regulator PhoB